MAKYTVIATSTLGIDAKVLGQEDSLLGVIRHLHNCSRREAEVQKVTVWINEPDSYRTEVLTESEWDQDSFIFRNGEGN